MRFRVGSFAVGLIALVAVPFATNALGETLKQVDANSVCVAGNHVVGAEACAAKLAIDPASRFAIDPVSGNEVDKATATLGVDKAGNVFFFENVRNLKRFRLPLEPLSSASCCTSRPSHSGR